MAKRRMGIIALLLCFCLMSMPALAASVSDAKEPILTNAECTLTVSYGYDGQVFPKETVNLYQIADISSDFQYTLTASFADTGLILNGIQTNGEWNVIRSTLETWVIANHIAPTNTVATDEAGQAQFKGLTPGLYLVSDVTAVQETLTCYFASVLVAVPGLGADGLWQDQVEVAAKPTVLPPMEPDEELQLKVLKLWKDDGKNRPQSIQVEILRDGISYEKVTLSESNNWSYSWTTLADGAIWNVVEKDVPAGYTMTVEQRDHTFVITNTRPDAPKPNPPKTGDTNNILVYCVVMCIAGTLLLMMGTLGKRNRHEETK